MRPIFRLAIIPLVTIGATLSGCGAEPSPEEQLVTGQIALHEQAYHRCVDQRIHEGMTDTQKLHIIEVACWEEANRVAPFPEAQLDALIAPPANTYAGCIYRRSPADPNGHVAASVVEYCATKYPK